VYYPWMVWVDRYAEIFKQCSSNSVTNYGRVWRKDARKQVLVCGLVAVVCCSCMHWLLVRQVFKVKLAVLLDRWPPCRLLITE